MSEVAIVEELEELQEAERCLAFGDSPSQQAYSEACSYSDVWRKVHDSRGNAVAITGSYYICLDEHRNPRDSLLLISSNDWHRAGRDPICSRSCYCTRKLHCHEYRPR